MISNLDSRKMVHRITPKDFANSFGTTVEKIRDECSNILDNIDFSYSIIDGYERDQLIINILKKIDEDMQIVGTPERQKIWNNGWKENYQDLIDNDYDLDKLVPKFIRYDQPLCHNLKYIKSSNPKFELDYYSVYRQWLFKTYLSKYNYIYEFGCGTGFNLVAIAQLYPDKRLYGLDFVSSSAMLINKIAEHYGYNMSGHLFDMTSPDKEFEIKEDSAIITIGSIEQLAGKFEKFIEYILEQNISLCIHVEPIIELYDKNSLVDYLGIKFINKRGYTKGLLSYLRKLEENGTIKILKVRRLFFGSLYIEGYSHIIWKPL